MDTAQIVIIFVVLVLTGLLVATGFQFFKILGEFRKTVEKINKMLDDGGLVTESVAKSIVGLSAVGAGIKTALSFLSFFRGNPPSHRASAGEEEKSEDMVDELENKKQNIGEQGLEKLDRALTKLEGMQEQARETTQNLRHRFFSKNGKKLA